MNIEILPSASRGQMKNPTFTGYHIFSNGMRNSGRPDGFGAAFVFNDDTMFPGAYLGMHPHANVEIVTIVIEGKESHEDNLDYHQELTAGDVQLISAGKGIQHAGGNVSETKPARHLQIWLAPDAANTPPSVQLKRTAGNKVINEWQPLISPDGKNDTLQIRQQAWLYEGWFETGSFSYVLQSPHHGVMIYMLDGELNVDGKTISKNDTVFISSTNEIAIDVEQKASMVLIESVLAK